MTSNAEIFNPFPGLRPFEASEDYLFFGREEHTDELLRRLRRNRFVAVIGESGSGKSSIVRAGMLPALYGGFVAGAGTDWRIAVLRPGADPIGNLATALADPEVLDTTSEDEADRALFRDMAAASLHRSRQALVQLVRDARLASSENLLILVDQFEELFRFRREAEPGTADESVAFVNLLLKAASDPASPVYVVITMRSDFLGDCTQIPFLPEAINSSQYLIPRLDRAQRERAIVGPAGVGGARLAAPLVQRLLNDMSDDPDQLPILQHTLMRTFERWMAEGKTDQPIGLEHYEAVGTLRKALSRHAEEAFEELEPAQHTLAAKIFKALTEKGHAGRDIRRPASLAQLAAIAGCTEDEVAAVVEVFRAPGRAFLMPPAGMPLAAHSVIDLSHESLMRNWRRLAKWVNEEGASALLYRRLSQTAELHAGGRAGLWRNPDLRITLDWREANQPTAFWAERYAPGFERAIAFLEASRQSAEAEERAALEAQAREVRNARRITAITTVALLIALGFVIYALVQNARIERQNHQVSSRQLALLAAEKEDDNHELALLLALESGRAAATLEAENVLRHQLRHAGRTVALLEGHRDVVLDVAWNGDGTRLLSASRDGRAAIWDAKKSGVPPWCWLEGHGDAVWHAAFSPDSKRVLTTSADGTARLWNAETCAAEQVLEGHGTLVPYGLWDAAGERVLTVGYDHTARVWNAADGTQLLLFQHTNQVVYAAWNEDQEKGVDLIATTDLTPAVRIFDGRNGHLVATYPAADLPRAVRHLEWIESQDQKPWLLLASDDGRLRYWDLEEGGSGDQTHRDWITGVWAAPAREGWGAQSRRLLTTSRDRTARFWTFNISSWSRHRDKVQPLFSQTELRHDDVVLKGAWSSDGESVATAGADGRARIFTYPQERPTELLTGHHGAVLDVAFSPDSSRLATAGEDATLRIWDPAPGVEAAELSRHDGAIRDVAWSSDGNFVATGGEDGVVHLSTSEGAPLPPLEIGQPILALDWHPGGRRLAVAGRNGLVEMWDTERQVRIRRFESVPGSITLIAWDPQGKRFFASGRNRICRVFDGQSGKILADLPHDAWVSYAAWSHDGTKIATAGVDTAVRVFDADKGELLRRFDDHSSAVLDLDWSPDDQRLASTSSDRTVRLWDVLGGKALATLEGHDDWVFAVAFSPDGKRLASASKDSSAKLWNAEDGTLLATLADHNGPVRHVIWSTDGERLLTTSDDFTARLWRANDGMAVSILTGHRAPLIETAMNPSGDRIITTDTDGRALIHYANLAELLIAGCKRSVRSLTDEEWRFYGDGGPIRPTCPIPEGR